MNETTAPPRGFGDARPAVRRATKENSLRHLVTHTWLMISRVLHRWRRDPAALVESLIMPVVLLVTVNTVLGDGITQITGHNALHGSVPLVAMVGAMSGAMIGGVSLMRERTDGLLSRLWTLPVHRATPVGQLNSRSIVPEAPAVRIVLPCSRTVGAAAVWKGDTPRLGIWIDFGVEAADRVEAARA